MTTAPDYGRCSECQVERTWSDVADEDDDGLCGNCTRESLLAYIEEYIARAKAEAASHGVPLKEHTR